MTANPDKPEELSRALLIRGRMAELIAEAQKAIMHPVTLWLA